MTNLRYTRPAWWALVLTGLASTTLSVTIVSVLS